MASIHPRVSHGSTAQQTALDHLVANCPTCTITSVANIGSNAPDIVAVIDGANIQCEVKSSFVFTSPVVTISKTVKRNHTNIIDGLVPIMSNGLWDSVEESVEHHRITDTTIGFPGDCGTPNSGKLPKCLKITDSVILDQVRQAIVENLAQHKDTYFILVCKHPHTSTHIYYTGYGTNVLNAPILPRLSMAKLRTYGTARKDSMRVALKVSFVPPKV